VIRVGFGTPLRAGIGAGMAQMGTIGVAATAQIGGRLGRLRPDVMFVDAPVSGSKAPAEADQLLILASGPREADAIVRQRFRRSAARPCGWARPARATG